MIWLQLQAFNRGIISIESLAGTWHLWIGSRGWHYADGRVVVDRIDWEPGECLLDDEQRERVQHARNIFTRRAQG